MGPRVLPSIACELKNLNTTYIYHLQIILFQLDFFSLLLYNSENQRDVVSSSLAKGVSLFTQR